MRYYSVILCDDNKNSFLDVIKALVSICNHNALQAEQCATIVHNAGECPVKERISLESAERYCELLTTMGLTVRIGVPLN